MMQNGPFLENLLEMACCKFAIVSDTRWIKFTRKKDYFLLLLTLWYLEKVLRFPYMLRIPYKINFRMFIRIFHRESSTYFILFGDFLLLICCASISLDWIFLSVFGHGRIFCCKLLYQYLIHCCHCFFC